MVMINMPRLVKSGKQTDTLQVYDATVSLNITPLSTAVFTLKTGAKVDTRAFYEVYTELGSAGIFRARSPRIGVGSQLTTVDLDHAIVEVGDYLITDDIEQEMTLSNALKKVFTFYKGGKWKLGTVKSGSTKVVLKANYDTCLDVILDLISQVPKVYLTFDFSAYPWTVNVANRPTTISAEGRISRNVKSAVISRDDTELCTRVYMEGLPGTSGNKFGHLDADTLKKYGTVEREITGTNSTEAIAKKTAEAYLEKHKHPAYSIQIEAIDLSAITGETLDKFTIGKLMRLALPDEGITVEETISQITWGNVYTNPKGMTVVLSDEKDTIVKTIKDSAKASGGGGGGGSNGKQIQKLFTRFDQTDEYIDMWAVETDTQGEILKQAGLYLDKNKVLQYATDAKRGIAAQIETRADKIEASVTNTKSELESKITTEANRISLVVEGTGKNAHIKPASIVASINGGSSNVKLKADTIDIDGMVSALAAKTLYAQAFIVYGSQGGTVNIGRGLSSIMLEQDGNTYTLKQIGLLDTQPTVVGTFSRATTLSGEWSGGTYTVTADPQGNTESTSLSDELMASGDTIVCRPDGTPDASGKYIKRNYYVQYGSGEDVQSTGQKITPAMDATPIFNNGVNSVTLSGTWVGSTAGKYYQVTASNGKTNVSPALDVIEAYGTKHWATDKKSFTQSLRAYDTNGTDIIVDTQNFTTSESYYAGSASVTQAAPTWSGSSSSASRTMTVSTSGRTNESGSSSQDTKSYTMALQISGNGQYVYLKQGSTTRLTISIQ